MLHDGGGSSGAEQQPLVVLGELFQDDFGTDPAAGLAARGGQEEEQAPRRPRRRLSAPVSREDELRPEDAAELRGAGAEQFN